MYRLNGTFTWMLSAKYWYHDIRPGTSNAEACQLALRFQVWNIQGMLVVCWFLKKPFRNADLPSFTSSTLSSSCHSAASLYSETETMYRRLPNIPLPPNRNWDVVRKLYGSISFLSTLSQISYRAGPLTVPIAWNIGLQWGTPFQQSSYQDLSIRVGI